jgi:hypothetical protein
MIGIALFSAKYARNIPTRALSMVMDNTIRLVFVDREVIYTFFSCAMLLLCSYFGKGKSSNYPRKDREDAI